MSLTVATSTPAGCCLERRIRDSFTDDVALVGACLELAPFPIAHPLAAVAPGSAALAANPQITGKVAARLRELGVERLASAARAQSH